MCARVCIGVAAAALLLLALHPAAADTIPNGKFAGQACCSYGRFRYAAEGQQSADNGCAPCEAGTADASHCAVGACPACSRGSVSARAGARGQCMPCAPGKFAIANGTGCEPMQPVDEYARCVADGTDFDVMCMAGASALLEAAPLSAKRRLALLLFGEGEPRVTQTHARLVPLVTSGERTAVLLSHAVALIVVWAFIVLAYLFGPGVLTATAFSLAQVPLLHSHLLGEAPQPPPPPAHAPTSASQGVQHGGASSPLSASLLAATTTDSSLFAAVDLAKQAAMDASTERARRGLACLLFLSGGLVVLAYQAATFSLVRAGQVESVVAIPPAVANERHTRAMSHDASKTVSLAVQVVALLPSWDCDSSVRWTFAAAQTHGGRSTHSALGGCEWLRAGALPRAHPLAAACDIAATLAAKGRGGCVRFAQRMAFPGGLAPETVFLLTGAPVSYARQAAAAIAVDVRVTGWAADRAAGAAAAAAAAAAADTADEADPAASRILHVHDTDLDLTNRLTYLMTNRFQDRALATSSRHSLVVAAPTVVHVDEDDGLIDIAHELSLLGEAHTGIPTDGDHRFPFVVEVKVQHPDYVVRVQRTEEMTAAEALSELIAFVTFLASATSLLFAAADARTRRAAESARKAAAPGPTTKGSYDVSPLVQLQAMGGGGNSYSASSSVMKVAQSLSRNSS